MANIKSAIKRIEIEKRNTAINKTEKTKISKSIKKLKTAIETKDIALAENLYKKLSSTLDHAVNIHIIHANKADKKKAYFTTLINNCKKA